MSTFYMMVGMPASGKSSEAEKLGAIVRSSDELREQLLGDVNNMGNNAAVFNILHSLVISDLYTGENVVYDATNIKASYRKDFLEKLSLLKCRKVCVFVDTPATICRKRNSERDRVVPKEAMDRMEKFLEAPTFDEGWDEIRFIRNCCEGGEE